MVEYEANRKVPVIDNYFPYTRKSVLTGSLPHNIRKALQDWDVVVPISFLSHSQTRGFLA